jgi:hypothetical protein
MKVVANIQISLHAKFHIFLRSPSISLFLFSPTDLFNWKKDLKWENRYGLFSLPSAQLYTDPGPSSHVSHLASCYYTTVADRWGPPVSSLFPQISPPLLARMATPTKLPVTGRPPITTSCHKDGRVFTATLSSRVGCSAPWCPVTVARLRLPSSALRRSDVCCGGHRLALPMCSCSHIARVHWHPSLRFVDTWMPPPPV